jgi:periplasmic protein CpxP/Spy
MTTQTMRVSKLRWIRLMAGSLMVVGGVMAATSAMNAWADKPSAGVEGTGHKRFCMHAMHRGGHGAGEMPAMMLGGRGLERMLDRVDATDAQRKQIDTIANTARTDLEKLHGQAQSLRKQSLAVLTQPMIDAAAAENLRQQMLTQHDAVTKRMLAAMIDISQVLTPEQRAKVADGLKQGMERHEKRHQRMLERHGREDLASEPQS